MFFFLDITASRPRLADIFCLGLEHVLENMRERSKEVQQFGTYSHKKWEVVGMEWVKGIWFTKKSKNWAKIKGAWPCKSNIKRKQPLTAHAFFFFDTYPFTVSPLPHQTDKQRKTVQNFHTIFQSKTVKINLTKTFCLTLGNRASYDVSYRLYIVLSHT